MVEGHARRAPALGKRERTSDEADGPPTLQRPVELGEQHPLLGLRLRREEVARTDLVRRAQRPHAGLVVHVVQRERDVDGLAAPYSLTSPDARNNQPRIFRTRPLPLMYTSLTAADSRASRSRRRIA